MGLILVDSAIAVVCFKIIVGDDVGACCYVIAAKTSLQFYVVYRVIYPCWNLSIRGWRDEPIVQGDAILSITPLKAIKRHDWRADLGSLPTFPGEILEDVKEKTKKEGCDDEEE